MTQIIYLPGSLNPWHVNDFCASIEDTPEDDHYIFDYSHLGLVEPYGMLLIGSALRRFISKRQSARFEGRGFQGKDYAAHMGFFKSIWLDYGKQPGEAHGSSTYLPITMIDANDLRKLAAQAGEHVGFEIERQSRKLASVLCQGNIHLADILTYSIRELMRNIVEHSRSDTVWIAGQYWPRRDLVEIAILDEGIGIRKSLSSNPYLKITSDRDALLFAIEPGISGKMYRGRRIDENDMWANSGFGLYMTSSLCGMGGTFVLTSGKQTMVIANGRPLMFRSCHYGTAVMMRLRVSRLRSLSEMTATLIRAGEARARKNAKIRTVVTASQVSRLLVANKNNS